MSTITVIGIGNRLYGDDGVGCELAQALSERDRDRRIRYLIGETDISWCLAQIETPYVVLLDAVQMGQKPGSVRAFRPEVLLPCQQGISMHNGHLLSLLHADAMKKGLLIGVEPYELAPFYGLSEAMRQDFERILDAAQKIISAYCYRQMRNGSAASGSLAPR